MVNCNASKVILVHLMLDINDSGLFKFLITFLNIIEGLLVNFVVI